MRREGVPQLPPQSLEEPDDTPPAGTPAAANAPRHPSLLSEPSPAAIEAADLVVQLQNEVAAIGLKRAREEGLDWFRDRQQRLASANTARQRHNLETQSSRVRQKWEAAWLEYAFIGCLPKDLPREIELDVYHVVQETLEGLELSRPREVVERLVRAAAEKGLQPWRRSKEIDKIVEETPRSYLPAWATGWIHRPSEWELRARRAAAEMIRQLDSDATIPEIRLAAIKGAKQVASEYEIWKAAEEHRKICSHIVACVWEGDEARESVRRALEKCPVGTPRAELEKARDAELEPFRAASRAAVAADRYLSHVPVYVEDLGNEAVGEWDLGSFLERRRLAEKLQKKIRPQLVQRFLKNDFDEDEIDAQAKEFIEELVERELGL